MPRPPGPVRCLAQAPPQYFTCHQAATSPGLAGMEPVLKPGWSPANPLSNRLTCKRRRTKIIPAPIGWCAGRRTGAAGTSGCSDAALRLRASAFRLIVPRGVAVKTSVRSAQFRTGGWRLFGQRIRRAAGLLVVALAFWGCSRSEPPKPAQAPAPPPPPAPSPPAPVTLAELAPVTLSAGSSTTIKVTINRGGHTGPAQFQLSGLPQGVTAKAPELPADKTEATIELWADPKLGDKEEKATVKLAVKVGQGQAERSFALTIPRLALPKFAPAKPVLLQPGIQATVELSVDRGGFQGPLDLAVQNLPKGVSAKVARLEANQNATRLELAAAPDAPDAKQAVQVVGSILGRTLSVDVPVEIVRTPFRVQAFRVVTIRPGEKQKIELPIERRAYQGPLEIAPVDLPAGVKVASVQVAPDQRTVALEIVAEENAAKRVRTARVVAKGGRIAYSEPIVVRVKGAEEGFFPSEILNDPTMPLLRRGSFGGRLTARAKQALLEAYGGTAESEAAVMRGLKWLAAHQRSDGAWSLKAYDAEAEQCDCRDAKFEEKVTDDDVAGTAFGVLPFLGAGVGIDQAPEEPPELAHYQSRVLDAIAFLVKRQVKSNKPTEDGRLSTNMYAHAAGTIALCEAFGLSSDRWKERLKLPAQRAIRFIAQAQHKDGGWRYQPRQPGDMSAVGWQFLAIRSGQLAGMPIGNDPLIRAERFVDSCAAGPPGAEKSQYSYLPGEKAKISTTAAGLLTRQYLLKWKKDHPDLLAGCKEIMKNLPPESGTTLGPIYYYYYATQVLHHMEGEDFDLWNARMREHLIRTQEKMGHRAGSWNPQGTDWGSAGGRLYATGMALMTLQVYYRHLPLYRTVAKKTSRRAIDPLAPVPEE